MRLPVLTFISVGIKNICLLSIAISFFLSSCIPDPVDIDIKQSSRFVVTAQLSAGKIPIINLTKSFDLFSGVPNQNDIITDDFLKKIAVSDALVILNSATYSDTLQMLEPGMYSGKKLGITTSPYHLQIKDAYTNTEISAQTTVLPKIKFDNVFSGILEEPDDTFAFVSYSITDPPIVSKWFLINYYVKRKTVHQVNFDTRNFFQRGYNQFLMFQTISEADFQDHVYQNGIKLPNDVTVNDSVAITLSNITEEEYNYLQQLQKSVYFPYYAYYSTNYLPSNVINGMGYFSVHDPDVVLIEIK